jgi:murein L,D-transpeptidase YafK
MKFFLFILLTTTLFANEPLIDLYQKEGSTAIEKVFDKILGSPEYWEKKLENTPTRLGYFESINALLTCDKNSSQLTLYTKNEMKAFQLDNNFTAFVGKRKGDKQKEGDLKTPIGVYKLIQKLENVDPFYGPLAFVTSYPNTYDKIRGKNGSGIWVHGLPMQQKRDTFTRGCIAISNDHLKEVEAHINPKQTLVFIDNHRFPEVKKAQLAQILAGLYQWKSAWSENNLDNYMDFYSPQFKRSDGLNYQRFKQYKQRIFSRKTHKRIHFEKINIIPYPSAQDRDTFLIFFKEHYFSPHYSFQGDKELYIKLHDHTFQILAEK